MVSARRREVIAENRAVAKKAEVVDAIVKGKYMPEGVHNLINRSFRPIIPIDTRIAAQICDMLSCGAVINWIAEQPWFPGMRSLRSWLATDADFRAEYEAARKHGAELIVGMTMEEALKPAEEGNTAAEMRRSTIVKYMTWYAEKMNRKDYGQHMAMQVDVTETHVLDPHYKEAAVEAMKQVLAERDEARMKVIEHAPDTE